MDTPGTADYELLLASESDTHKPAELASMGFDEQIPKPEGRRGDLIAFYSALTAAGVFAGVSWVLILKNLPSSWFAVHPPLQSLAVVLFTYGVLTLQPTSQQKTKAAGLVRHQLAILYIGLPAVVVGTLAIVFNKWVNESRHFTTWHGTFGIICTVWLVLQAALGGASVWFGGAAFGGGMKAKAIWKYHRLSGYVLFPMLLLTCHFGGAWSNWGAKNSGYALRLVAYTVAPAVILASIYARVRLSKMKFF